jgi:5-methylcytosine-specific restriction endonuclease McrA
VAHGEPDMDIRWIEQMNHPADLSLRDRIFKRDEYRCVYCGLPFPGEQLSLDHVQPRMRGGDNSEGNLVTACHPCNGRKGSLPAWAFLAELPDERANFLRYATAVWPRHLRAIHEAARAAKLPRG